MKGAADVGRLKALWLILLAASVAAVLSAGTLAAYTKTMEISGNIRAARFVFNVNDSGEETQSLGVRELVPGGRTTIDIKIDTSGSEVGVDVLLEVGAFGSALPPGIQVWVDGESIGPTGSSTKTYRGLDGSRTVPVEVFWNTTPEELLTQYQESQNLTLSLSASVTATQAA